MKKKHLNAFYGYPIEKIATWCGIGKSQAYKLKKGYVEPSKRVLELFEQHRKQQAPGSTWEGWRFVANSIYTPENKEITQGDIRALPYLKQLNQELLRAKEGLQNEVNTLKRVIADIRTSARLHRRQLEKCRPDVRVSRTAEAHLPNER